MNLDWYPTISTTYSSSVRPKILTNDLFEQTVSFTSEKTHSSLSCKSSVYSAWITPDTGGRTKTGAVEPETYSRSTHRNLGTPVLPRTVICNRYAAHPPPAPYNMLLRRTYLMIYARKILEYPPSTTTVHHIN